MAFYSRFEANDGYLFWFETEIDIGGERPCG